MNKYIKNDDTVNHTYQGQVIEPAEYFLIPSTDQVKWAEDSTLLKDIVNADAIVCSSNDTASEIADVNLALNYLKDFGVSEVNQTLEIPSGGATNMYFGFQMTATKTTTTTVDTKVIPDFHLHSGYVECKDSEFGDKISFSIVDVDNLLGYGAGTVLKKYVYDINIPSSGISEFPTNKKTELNLKNFYMRIDYVSVGTVNDVELLINMRGFDT